MQHVLIVTHGRTGSTLLQGILNTIDGFHIKGENKNVAFHLFQSYKSLAAATALKELDDPYSPTNPWYGSADYNLDSYSQELGEALKKTLTLKPTN